MLNVDNKRVINKITMRTIKANKTRNLFIIIAIALTTTLIASVFSIGMSFLKSYDLEKIRIMGTTAHCAITHPTAEQIEKIKGLDYVKTIGEQYHAARIINTPEMKNMSLTFFRYEENEWENHREGAITGFKGKLPQKYNEVMMPVWVLNTMGIKNPEIGMEIPFKYTRSNDYDDATEEIFILSAYFTDYLNIRSGNINSVFVSGEFAKAGGNNITEDGSLSITFKADKNINDCLIRLEKDIVLSENQQVKPVPVYSSSGKDSLYMALSLGIIVAIIMFSGYLLIYNILYISVTKDIRFYGLLKTVGTTPGQLRKIVIRQAIILASVGIVIGVAASALLSFAVVPFAINAFSADNETGTAISFNPLIFIGAAVFAMITTWISARKPARMAGKITPVEAVRFTSRTISKKSKKGTNGGKIYKMAAANMFREKKRAFVVIMSLFLGLTVFLVINVIVASMDTDNLVASYMEHDFTLYNNTFDSVNGIEQKFDDKFTDTIKNMEGVTYVETVLLQLCELEYDVEIYSRHLQAFEKRYDIKWSLEETIKSGYQPFYGYLVGIDAQCIEELNETLETPLDVEAFRRGEICFFGNDDPSLFPADAIIKGGAIEGENEFEFKLGGFVPFLYKLKRGGMVPNTYISKEAFANIVDDPIVYTVYIDAEPQFLQTVSDKLKSFADGDNDISLESKAEMQKTMKESRMMLYILGLGLSIIIALIGILNFVNVMVTSITVRSVELAMMESIGMTKKQVKSMLMLEGTGYFIISAFLVMSLGSGITFAIYMLFKQQADYAVFNYPFLPVLLILAIVLTVCICTPLTALRLNEKETIVERLRKAE